MYVWFLKLMTFMITLASVLVYNFHKPIKGIKKRRNISYKKKPNFYEKMDVYYHKDKDQNIQKKPIIMYFHGGGWTCYSKCIYNTLCRRLAKMGYVVFNANYSLAPLYKMDKIISDCVMAINKARQLAEKYGADADNIVLAGDSAGAHLSALVSGMINNGKIDMPELKGKIKALLLFYGVYDLNTMVSSRFPRIRTYGKAVLRGKIKDKEENSKYSPINYVNKDFPPCFMASGEIDKLHQSQSKQMNIKLKENNVKVNTLFFEKEELRAMHAYMVFDGLQTNIVTLEKANEFLKEIFKC